MKYFIKIIKKILGIRSPSKELMNIPYEYVEKDTKCDLCDNRSKCEEYLLECTFLSDTRRHFIPMMGFICPKN